LMARRGRKRQLDVESGYWQLLLSGVGTVEACRLVGVDPARADDQGNVRITPPTARW
jgi:hypothetical protein